MGKPENSMPVPSFRQWGGWTAIIGGLLWCVKGMAILLTGVQPLLLFEIAPLFFAIGIRGMYVVLDGHHSRLARTGIAVASLGGAAAAINILAERFTPELIPQAESVTWLTPSYILAGFGWPVGLLLVGVDVWHARPFSAPWNQAPLSMVVAFFLLMSLFGAISTALDNERLVEAPIVLVGLVWMALGAVYATSWR